jgi:hypothetical protein
MQDYKLDVESIRYNGNGIGSDKASSAFVGTKEAPLFVFIDSNTDFVALVPSVAGVVVALIVALFTVRVQQNQIKANISNFRHQWMAELRGAASEYIQVMFVLAHNLEFVKDYRNSETYKNDHARMAVLGSKIDMLLSRNDEATEKLFELDVLISERLNKLAYQEDCQLVINQIIEYKDLVRKELENAWIDIQDDLGRKSRFFGFRLIKSKKQK